jgi:hypothetical protein
MERIEQLISKLREEWEHKAPVSQLLLTVKLIEAQLNNLQVSIPNPPRSTKVAVVMPSGIKSVPGETEALLARVAAEPEKPAPPSDTRKFEPQPLPREEFHLIDPLSEIPTLSQQPGSRELNDVIGMNGSSINDKLKADYRELAHTLKETPVRELKKAIGVNDRYTFISELFRGDEVMYERSIKTINNFRILPEAEYWMERELKIKLGWDDSREITRHFYQLVKRRFS